MGEAYLHAFSVRWFDLDANGHMKNTAYMEYAIQTRFECFKAHGFSPKEFNDRGFGPVVFKDEISYIRELRLLDDFVMTFHVSNLSDDGVRFVIHNVLTRADQVKAAHIITTGAWFDLQFSL